MFARNLLVRAAWKFQKKSGLEQKLIAEGKTRWLDVGSSRFDDGFTCLNLHSPDDLSPEHAARYYQADLENLSEADLENLGTFDLLRMQHVFEHLPYEKGSALLKQCAQLLKPNGYLLISVPDLEVHAKSYLNRYQGMKNYVDFAHKRIPEDAPPSFIFSIFCHQFPSIPGDQHHWCYDYAGLVYLVEKCNAFKNVQRLSLFHPLAGLPFTHNRPDEDVCLLAQKI